MWIRALLAAATVALLAPAPASALQHKIPIVAYGEGTTTCIVTVNSVHRLLYGGEQRYDFHGRTECDAAVEQSGQAWLNHRTPSLVVTAPLCSGFRAACESRGSAQGEDYAIRTGPASYRVTLRAPLGQGWVTAPTDCSGVGTDNLTCTFDSVSSQDTLLFNNV